MQKKWEGDLVVSGDALCRVQVEPVVGTSSRLLPILLRSLTVLELTESYPAFGIHYFLTAAYDPPTEFARVTADAQNLTFLQNISLYMEHECKVSEHGQKNLKRALTLVRLAFSSPMRHSEQASSCCTHPLCPYLSSIYRQ